MRFHKVDLTLPEQGLFCIQGSNESGKSTIGSLIYFALSGCGPKGEAPESLINWEKNQLKLKLTFLHRGITFQLLRQVDRDGSNFSQLAKDNDEIAQGNTAICDALKKELGYQPEEILRSFLITHRIVQKLVHEPSVAHIDYMLGLDQLSSLSAAGRNEGTEIESELEKVCAREKRLRDEQRSVGYDAEEERNVEGSVTEIRKNMDQLIVELEQSEGERQYLQNFQEVVEKSGRALPSKLDQEQTENLERALSGGVSAFSSLNMRESKKGILDKSIQNMKAMLEFIRDRGRFLSLYEAQLEQLRTTIGLGEENKVAKSSLTGQAQGLEQNIKVSHNDMIRWGGIGVFLSVITLALMVMVCLRAMLWSKVKDSYLWDFFHTGSGSDLRLSLETMLLENGIFGLPSDPRPWAILALLLVFNFTAYVLAIRSSKKRSGLRLELEKIQALKAKMKVSYHGLLAADIKDMLELSVAVDEFGDDKLQDEYVHFKNCHPILADKSYDLGTMIHEVREHLEEVVNNLKLESHQVTQRCDGLRIQKEELGQHFQKGEDRLKDLADKKVKVDQFEMELGKCSELLTKRKRDRAIKVYMAELAEGTLVSIRERLRRDLTLQFKELMPKITSDRYASIRFGKEFGIEVFSEERGDFVPLRQLSSGTNDLFVLILQLILVQGFMDARLHDNHFLFLDEPLLAVDGQRYQKLTDLLSTLSGGLQQIFLCRPPENQVGAYILETNIDNKELVADFTTS